MPHTASVVFTTIFDPVVLDDLYENFKKFGHLDQVKVFAIPDKKTPETAYKRCEDLKQKGFSISFPTLEEQEDFLKKVNFPPNLIPYNSDNRRNIGYLMALHSESDFIISIDDDNFCQENDDFFGLHEIVCQGPNDRAVTSVKNGWFNICDQLDFSPKVKTYPRGFPYYGRHKPLNPETNNKQKVNIKINQGLWLQDPDVDGISWLVNPAKVEAFKGNSIILDKNTWSPINTQNTSLHRDVIPSYYFIKMGYPLSGVPIDRYGDIFSGYFALKCVNHAGDYARFGDPIASHKRNSHNYLNDAANEWACVMVLEDLLPWLKETKLEGRTYSDAYISLSEAIQEGVESFHGKIWNDATRGYFHQVSYYMRKWVKVCKTLLNETY